MAGVLVASIAAVAYWQRQEGHDAPDDLLPYRQVNGHTLHLHLFRALPHAAAAAHQQATSALLLFHGGAWAHGHPRQFYPQCRWFSQQGITCISVAYRIASRHGSSPADAVDDARAALHWARQHADRLYIDPQRIAVGGGSAGGHLAAALGTGIRATPGDTVRPQALLLLNPMLDLSPGQPDHALVAPHWRALSPLHQVAPGMPPTLVQSGTADPEVPVATVQAFCQRVNSVGGRCEVNLFTGARHGFFNLEVDEGRHYTPVLQQMLKFLRQHGLQSPT